MCYVIERKQLIYSIDWKYFFGFKKYITHVKNTTRFDSIRRNDVKYSFSVLLMMSKLNILLDISN